MTPIATAFVTFVSTFGSSMLATVVRSKLPPAHLSKESQDVVRAVFLVLELDGPFDGLIKVSSGPFRFALTQLNQ